MRKVILFISLFSVFLFIIGCATTQERSARYEIQEVIEFNKSASDLYNLSLQWVPTYVRSDTDIIQYKDESQGKVIAKGFFMVAYTIPEIKTRYTMIVEVKEGKARITFNDIFMDHTLGGTRITGPFENDMQFNKFKQHADNAIENYKAFINKGSEEW